MKIINYFQGSNTKKIKNFRGKGNPEDFRGFETKFQTFENKVFKQFEPMKIKKKILEVEK